MPIGEPFIQLFEVDSTNNYAMAQMQAALADHGHTWLAHTQTAGKGQRGKSWLAAGGQSILMSFVVRPGRLLLSKQFLLSATVAVGVREFFDAYTHGDTSIKWPNDIYWKDRKAGGILIENLLQGNEWKYSVVGIGLNIQQASFDDSLSNPVSLRQITGKLFDTVQLAKELCTYIDTKWRQLLEGKEDELLASFQQNLYRLNEVVTFKMNNATFSARIKGVNTKGELVVDTGEQTCIPIGKVEWVLS
jgi:BirA family biotin operon repressor/biotin-[acetyl-CoA-carboxylase] ligase